MYLRGAKDEAGRVHFFMPAIGLSGDIDGVLSWCEFAVTNLPVIPGDVEKAVRESGKFIPVMKVVDGEIVARTLQEVQADIDA